jgi:hypothetical protein
LSNTLGKEREGIDTMCSLARKLKIEFFPDAICYQCQAVP